MLDSNEIESPATVIFGCGIVVAGAASEIAPAPQKQFQVQYFSWDLGLPLPLDTLAPLTRTRCSSVRSGWVAKCVRCRRWSDALPKRRRWECGRRTWPTVRFPHARRRQRPDRFVPRRQWAKATKSGRR